MGSPVLLIPVPLSPTAEIGQVGVGIAAGNRGKAAMRQNVFRITTAIFVTSSSMPALNHLLPNYARCAFSLQW